MRIVASAVLFLALLPGALAQPPNSDCANAALLCAQQPIAGNNTGATGVLPGFCPSTDLLLWYTFTTNSVGGVVNVEISGINCPVVAGMDDELSVVVLAGNGSCTPASFTAVSACTQSGSLFSSTTQALTPNTQYWVVVAGAMGGGATITAQCGFNITLSGPGMNIVGVDFDAGPDVEIPEGGATQLHVTGGTTYAWSPTSGLSGNSIPDPIANPASTTAYEVTTVINGCTYVDTVIVDIIRLIDPPNTFTPNGDGINDVWDVPGIVDYPGSEVLIYDRWGQRVFSSNGYREPWDGTNKGRPLSEGTYYYYIQLNELEGRSAPYSGFISIVR
ncbi:MAG: gliding motility-associated C-terminal domain-containing protein [Flavobacteriales bacterium]|nr:gliding motility-associated C-terminal domain-containing protein [Flavobacteriales bacterium]MCC6939262.1 gliding motility-associated C-terminal domain-containing protein [Flavobacteriales bacterium]